MFLSSGPTVLFLLPQDSISCCTFLSRCSSAITLRASLELGKLLASFASWWLIISFAHLPLFKALDFSEVTSFTPYPSQNQGGEDETKIHSQLLLPQLLLYVLSLFCLGHKKSQGTYIQDLSAILYASLFAVSL